MQTDGQTAQDLVVVTWTTTQKSIYNSLNMVRITMYLYVERDFVIGISYTGIQWLYLIINIRSYEFSVICEYSGDVVEMISTFSIVQYSKIKILSAPAIIQSFILFEEMRTTLSS